MGSPLEATILSEKNAGPGPWDFNFTNAFAALARHDLAGSGCLADLAWFNYLIR